MAPRLNFLALVVMAVAYEAMGQKRTDKKRTGVL